LNQFKIPLTPFFKGGKGLPPQQFCVGWERLSSRDEPRMVSRSFISFPKKRRRMSLPFSEETALLFC